MKDLKPKMRNLHASQTLGCNGPEASAIKKKIDLWSTHFKEYHRAKHVTLEQLKKNDTCFVFLLHVYHGFY
jgi:hypothetical protein